LLSATSLLSQLPGYSRPNFGVHTQENSEGRLNSAAYIGRVGGLAIALGIGAVLAGGIGVAAADESGSDGGASSSSSSSATGSSGSTSSGSPSASDSKATPKSSSAESDTEKDTTKQDDTEKDDTEKDTTKQDDTKKVDTDTADEDAAEVAPTGSKSGSSSPGTVADESDDDEKISAPPDSSDSSDTAPGALAAAAAVGSAKTTPTSGSSTVKAAAATGTVEPLATAAAVIPKAAKNPVGLLFVKMRQIFFNKTPTVRFDPSESVTNADGSITGKVHMNDADGDKLTVRVRDILNGGVVAVDANGNFQYWAGDDFEQAASTDRFIVTVSDAGNGIKFHGVMGLFVPGYGEKASTTVTVDRSVTAAGVHGWGSATKATNFSSMRTLLQQGWRIYSGPGNGGRGVRTPDALSFEDNIMTITGTADGTSGGLGWWPNQSFWSGHGQTFGMWEVRAKVPVGAPGYSAVALLWPDAENWPAGGEINFLEIKQDGTRQRNTAALHYGPLNTIVTKNVAVDATEWHNYAVEWTPEAITYYVDAVPYWTITDTSKFPPGSMHLALQLDVHTANIGDGASMEVAWARQYKYQS
jgi:Glycosyl hydrolases family 16